MKVLSLSMRGFSGVKQELLVAYSGFQLDLPQVLRRGDV